MEFEFTKRACGFGMVSTPTLPIIFNGFPVGNALVDTGADITLLPLEVNKILTLELDTENAIDIESAGGGKFKAIPAKQKLEYTLEHSGFKPITWKGTVYFAPRQPTILLGQHECLSELTITFDGPRRKIRVEPRHC